MGELEKKIKEMILEKYGSLNKFSDKIEMPWTTLDSVLKRGINKSNISSVIRICQGLQISADALANEKVVSIEEYRTNEFPKEIRAAARGMMNLSPKDQETAFEMINYLIQKGKEEQ